MYSLMCSILFQAYVITVKQLGVEVREDPMDFEYFMRKDACTYL